ncbi:hypothetical protein CIG75_14925 [Tumebacillus algifaecis]|uniref:DUF1648 domain-containing protein n=1 Tax=Tumebacillus algifaecis TaxID=1214604 RepID=A0A223D421_9BACL|nr:SdpI family protein [Tumebacillus algifaecis]ASS76124.1 hypothetical protein CIG75_14925 [Tumebacillus algifaecis]
MKKHILPLLFIVISIAASIWVYPQLPDQVPTHWGPSGEVDDYSSKSSAVWFSPILMILIYALLVFMPRIDPKRANYQRFSSTLTLVNTLLMLIFLGIQGAVISQWLGYDFNMSLFAPLLVGVLFLVLGNYMPRFQQNYAFGVRTPWTLANEEVWRKTHHFAGRAFVICGVLLLLSLLLPSSWHFPALLILVLGSTLLIIASSYYFYKNQGDVH